MAAESTGSSILRSILAASAGATAVFVLQRWFFRRDEAPLVAAIDSLETRVARIEGARAAALPPSPQEDAQVWTQMAEYTR